MRPLFIFLIINCFCWKALSQPFASSKGSFQTNQKLGCVPLTINLTQLIPNSFTAEYNYEGGNTLTLSKSHTFSQPGIYNVVAIYNGLIPNSTDNADNITITVTENVQPEFEISTCSNNQVSVKVLDSRYSQYLVDFNNDNTVDKTILLGGPQTETFQYSSLANQTITVRGRDLNGADNCVKKLHSITPLAALPAATINTLTVMDANSVQLDYAPAANIQYRGVIATDNSGTFQIFQTFNSSTNSPQSITQASLATDDHYYCFRLDTYDPCNNSIVPSNTICSLKFGLSFASDVNQLNWGTVLTNIDSFTVQRDQSDYRHLTGTSFQDEVPDIVCNTDYCYAIVANYFNGSKSTSLEKCGKSFSNKTPTAIEYTSAVVDGNSLELTWVQDTLFIPNGYAIKRIDNGNPVGIIGTSNTTTYTDDAFALEGNYCYSISYSDVCDNLSPESSLICPIVLSGMLTLDNFVQLNWTEYNGWKTGVKEYQITQFDMSGNPTDTFATSNLTLLDNTNDPELQTVEYLVTALPNDTLLTESISNRIRLTKMTRLIFPTAFTPNGDNLNETFTVIGQYVEKMKLQIFDRWGTLLFSTENSEPWDGTLQGRAMPESTYVWKAFITDKSGKTTTQIGMVALLRK